MNDGGKSIDSLWSSVRGAFVVGCSSMPLCTSTGS
jgi:hypothetical protein